MSRKIPVCSVNLFPDEIRSVLILLEVEAQNNSDMILDGTVISDSGSHKMTKEEVRSENKRQRQGLKAIRYLQHKLEKQTGIKTPKVVLD